ncbi:unnamed protein product [Brachionus calyciflorus]|uniref:Uncharacterized protein n=1 Tax=Brachionus calyciflorus TaxID=104777 RepID=A0A814S8I5_9BILA|nr:unnamed protein product [Brachionus calyciflorus]
MKKFYERTSQSFDVLSSDEYIDIDNCEPTGENLSLDDIINLVKDEDEIEEISNENKDINDEDPKTVSKKDLLSSIENLESFFMNCKYVSENHLFCLNQLKDSLEEIIDNNRIQSKISDFFIK